MSAERISLDSNVLVYCVDRDAGARHRIACDVVDRCVDRDCVLAVQALSEFFFVATRKGKMPAIDAAAQIDDWQILFPTATPRATTLRRAIRAVADHGLAFWDAMLWAVAAENGVTALVSEDCQDGRIIGGVRFVNPFGGGRFDLGRGAR
jgi:predicted nucleic acid-binding protein